MSGARFTTQQMDPSQENSQAHSQQRKIKLTLFLVSFAFSTGAFITFDYSYSAAIQHTREAAGKRAYCRGPDPVRHWALKPNCATTAPWGEDSYEFLTNSLGFRDEKIRAVPLADTRPRILILGDSFTEGMIAWCDSYVGRIVARFPRYDFLNGGVVAYSPSNYLNTTRMVLAKGADIDETIVFIGIEDVQDEAAFYRDIDASGAVTGPERERRVMSWDNKWRSFIAGRLLLTDYLIRSFGRFLVGHGYYELPTEIGGPFDMRRSAWTYRKVNETDPYPSGYAPLGLEAGIAKEKAKMTLLWQELERRNIPISVVVYPWPAQLVHDTADSRQVRIWSEWCDGKCKRFISLFPAFLAAKDACARTQAGCWYLSLFIYGDIHYSAAGNALVADAVIKSLAEEPPAKRPGSNLMPESGPGLGAH